MNFTDDLSESEAGGNFWKGVLLALLCQFTYLFSVYELPWADARTLGYVMFALLQFAYLFPLSVFYQKRNQALTSSGVIVSAVFSLVAAAIWFGYAAFHGALLPLVAGN
jgi:hypothetical protein